jgi:predicted DNA-binding protein with PD1-like motif
MACSQSFAKEERAFAAQITAIGALSCAVLKYFEWDRKKYLSLPVEEQVVVASLVGDVAENPPGEPVHFYVVLGKRDDSATAGHLGEALMRPTLEAIVTESRAHLKKIQDRASGLALIRPGSS